MDEILHRAVTNSGIVIPPARQRSLSPPLRSLHRRILRHFTDHATAPLRQLLGEWAHDLGVDLDAALGQLVAADLIETDPTAPARLLGAYPFTAIARGHTVQIDGGPTVQAYCAVDALGISRMLGRDEQWRWPAPYRHYADLLQRSSTLATVAEAHRDIWTRVVQTVPDGAAALLIGHGGGIEPGLVACLPDADHESWGAPFTHCDGARLSFEDARFVGIQFQRVHPLPDC
jgi:hypothetical protein